MRYFNIKQDTRIQNFPKIKHTANKMLDNNRQAQTFQTVDSTSNIGFCALPLIGPLIGNEYFFISQEMHYIFEAYQVGSTSKLIAINHGNQVFFYYIYQPPILDCIDETSLFNHDNTIKKLILNQNKILPHKIFQPSRLLEKFLIIDFDVLEILLAEAIYPFFFQEVDTLIHHQHSEKEE